MADPTRVLIVEDVPSDAELVERELRRSGLVFESRVVEDEEAFLGALAGFGPDVVLSDYSLPRFSGLDALRLLLERQPHLPLVMVTGSINEETAVECIKSGAADYVIKEHLGRLGTAVRSAIERGRLLAEAEAAKERQAREYALLQTVLDSTGTILVAVDHSLRYLTFNRSYAQNLESAYRTSPVVGGALFDSFPPGPERDRIVESLRRSLGGESLTVERFRMPEGDAARYFTVAFNPLRTRDGTVIGAVAVAQDRTERVRDEARLRQLVQAVDQSPASIIITDTQGRIEYVNSAFERITGYASAEAVGENTRLLKSGKMSPEFYRELWETILSGREWRGELQNRNKSGELYWELASIAPVRDEKGHVTHFVATKEDVTERKRAEELLRQRELQLAAARKMEAVGRLAGGVAHDFNNLLSVIRGHAERLLAEAGADAPGRSRLEQILWSAGRAATLTRQLLAFSRRQVLEPKVLRLDAVAREARDMLARMVGEHVELAVVSPDELGHVRADAGQVVQILLNLAVNARDAMPRGGRVGVELADVDVDPGFAAAHRPMTPGRYVLMAVSDTGAGMDKTTLSRVFEPFFTTKPEGQGAGLGLATVYGIVKQSGGFIWVDSEPGHGATFKIYLPRVDAPVEAHPPAAAARPRPGPPGSRILLVEDDAGVRDLMAELLVSEGYAVQVAANPKEAIALFEGSAERTDLLLTDVIMPGMSGRDLARALLERQPDLRVLYVSGYAGEAVTRVGGLDPGQRFLQKPFSEADLLRQVLEALSEPAGAP